MISTHNKILFLTGASTKVGYIFGILKALFKNGYKPNKIYCTSATAIIMLHVVSGKWEEAKKLIINFSDKQIFGKYKPLNNKGIPTLMAIWRILRGKVSLGKQENLLSYMKENISYDLFHDWQSNKDTPEIIVYVWNFETKQNELFDLRKLSYKKALDVIEASSNIPIFINPKYILNTTYYDGGSVTANIAPEVIKKDFESISEVTSIWNRKEPKDVLKDIQEIKLSSVLKLAFNYFLKIRMPFESLKCQELQSVYCQLHNIKERNFYTYTQIDSQYDNEECEKRADIENGYNATIKQL